MPPGIDSVIARGRSGFTLTMGDMLARLITELNRQVELRDRHDSDRVRIAKLMPA
jgi:hypothetical protein